MKAQRAQKGALDNVKGAKDFNSFRKNIQKGDSVRHNKKKAESCKFHSTWH